MMSKSLRRTFIDIYAVGAFALLAALGAVAGISPSRAQTPTPSPTPTPSTKPKQAYIRFWNMLPSQPPTVLELVSGDKPLVTAAICNFYAGYMAVTPGAFTLTVRRAGDQNGSIKRLPVNLQPEMYVTLLVSNKNDQPNVDFINDTIDPKAASTRQLVIRQLFPNAKVTVAVATAPAGPTLSYGETTVMTDLPATQSSLTVQANIPGQAAKSWSMPIDLGHYPHDTLLIFPDPYGRFRPRLAIDATPVDDAGHGEGEHH